MFQSAHPGRSAATRDGLASCTHKGATAGADLERALNAKGGTLVMPVEAFR